VHFFFFSPANPTTARATRAFGAASEGEEKDIVINI
jgi:hypothetical protein